MTPSSQNPNSSVGKQKARRRALTLDTLLLIFTSFLIALVANAVSPVGISWSTPQGIMDTTVDEQVAERGLQSVNLAEAVEIVNDGEYLIFDARSHDSFTKGHLPGAMSLPLKEVIDNIPQYLPLLVPDQPVMVYCSGRSCDDSIGIAEILKQHGSVRITVFTGGYSEWVEAGYEIEAGE